MVTAYQEYKDYQRLKSLFNSEDWTDVFQQLLSDLEKARNERLYLKIIIEEKLDERLLAYAKRYVSRIDELYPHLIENHLSEVDDLFVEKILSDAENASERKSYKAVCKQIKKYKKACGELNSRKLIEELMKKYPRRPAFLDELQKIK